MSHLDIIREKCIAANPEKEWEKFCGESDCGKHDVDCGRVWPEPIRLADVLLAIEANREHWDDKQWFTRFFVGTDGLIQGHSNSAGLAILSSRKGHPFIPDLSWNLRDDDLAKQSPETIEFIASLLP